jgi:hypothetical protein
LSVNNGPITRVTGSWDGAIEREGFRKPFAKCSQESTLSVVFRTEEQVREIFAQRKEAVVVALLEQTRMLAEQQEAQAGVSRESPVTTVPTAIQGIGWESLSPLPLEKGKTERQIAPR